MMSPQTGLRRYTHTHSKWFKRTLVFSTLHCTDFSFFCFLFFFLRAHRKHKNAHKRFSLLWYFLSIFFIFVCLFTFLYFFWLSFCAFGAFLCFFVLFCAFCAFLCVQSISVKNNKRFKTALIISFILLPS